MAATVKSIELLACDAGWRAYDFIKLTTSDGIIGWAEYDAPPGATAALQTLAERVVGKPALDHERVFFELFGNRRTNFNGVSAMAIGAIENALLDAKAKTLGVPCYELLGGRLRDTVRVYWSHCASFRISRPEHYGPPIKSWADLKAVGAEVKAKGFTALKTNIILNEKGGLTLTSPGFARPFAPELNVDRKMMSDVRRSLEVLREGTGPDVDLLIDLNFNCRTEGYVELLRAIADLDVFWIEIDMDDADALAYVRSRSAHPIASCETLYGIRQYKHFLRAKSADVVIIDAIRNGIWQSMKIAATAEAHDVNIAPHNFYGHLATMMNAHFAACVPNLRIMETDIDRLPWDAEIFPNPPKFKDGHILLPDLPGWGCDPDEKAIRARPAKH